MPEPLKYREREMTPDVMSRNGAPIHVDHLAHILRHRSQQVIFEPGDVTRYDLVLTPIESGSDMQPQHGLLITRLVGGEPRGTAILWDWFTGASPFQIEYAARILGCGNTWSTTLFQWWLTHLCAA